MRKNGENPGTVRQIISNLSNGDTDLSRAGDGMNWPSELKELGLLDYLENDRRPAFVIDLDSNTRATSIGDIIVVFTNTALRTTKRLDGFLDDNTQGSKDFQKWLTQSPGEAKPYEHLSTIWSMTTVGKGWRVLSGNESIGTTLKTPISVGSRPTYLHAGNPKSKFLPIADLPKTPKETPTVRDLPRPISHTMDADGALPPFVPDRSAYISFVKSRDWASTSLGPMSSWSPLLHQMVDLVLSDSRPVTLYWGPEKNIIYNEAYSLLTGTKHPDLMGKKCVDAWPEAASILIATMEKSEAVGQASIDDEWLLFLERLEDKKPEETYFSWSIVPVFDDGKCVGFVNPVFETTGLRIAERRMSMLLTMGDVLADAKNVSSFWSKIVEGLESLVEYDVPVAVLYSIGEDKDGKVCQFEGSLGIPENHPVTPPRIELVDDSEAGLAPFFLDAIQTGKPILIPDLSRNNRRLAPSLMEGIKWRGFEEPVKASVICPIRPTRGENVMGVLLLGLNPRRPYDSEYQKFISLFSQQLATSLASCLLFEEEARRGRTAAHQALLDQTALEEKLEESRQRFERLAEVVPVGMCFGTPEGNITYGNKNWYNITGFNLTKAPGTTTSFFDCVLPEDADAVRQAFQSLTTSGDKAIFEFRLQNPSGSPATQKKVSQDRTRWALANARADRDSNGIISNLTACLTEITEQKRTASEAEYRARLAEELSAKLNRFRRMAELATVGMFDLSINGTIKQANSTFYSITGLAEEINDKMPHSWMDCIVDDDRLEVEKSWEDLFLHGKHISSEIRLKKPWIDTASSRNIRRQRWILATAMPIRNSDGSIEDFTGCVTDISVQKHREKNEAERANLLDLLLIRTQEAKASEEKFTKFAQRAPVGISIVSPDGHVVFANDTWHELLRVSQEDTEEAYPWIPHIVEGDVQIAQINFAKVVHQQVHTSWEIRLKHPWKAPGDLDHDTNGASMWILVSAFPELSSDGSVKAVMTCLTDISHLKWAENLQKQRTEEALESKRQQENFIDMTSHEVRNPVSAIIQCADSIVSSLNDLSTAPNQKARESLVENGIDSAQIIISCAQHQKRIVDDILTLSKLDSKLLSITPVNAQPIKIVQDALRMFEAEAQRAGVDLKFDLDKSLEEMNVKWLYLDPSRLLQVLINLLTNAIKFTQKGDTRKISVRMRCTLERPSKSESTAEGIDYIPRGPREDLTLRPDWGSEETLFLHFSVQDSGRGMNESEKKLLFKRFSQTSPRTHIQYGGSGLGLFISRELTELQGGEIGVASEPGVGSTFAFYIKARKSNPPAGEEDTAATSRGISSPSVSGTGLSVLVVEDNLINAKVLSQQLKQAGYTVHVANHGGEALDFLKKTKYWKGTEDAESLDVVLMDIEMPIMDGLTCAKKIRELQHEGTIVNHVPIIAVSANARSEQILTAKNAGMVSASQ